MVRRRAPRATKELIVPIACCQCHSLVVGPGYLLAAQLRTEGHGHFYLYPKVDNVNRAFACKPCTEGMFTYAVAVPVGAQDQHLGLVPVHTDERMHTASDFALGPYEAIFVRASLVAERLPFALAAIDKALFAQRERSPKDVYDHEGVLGCLQPGDRLAITAGRRIRAFQNVSSTEGPVSEADLHDPKRFRPLYFRLHDARLVEFLSPRPAFIEMVLKDVAAHAGLLAISEWTSGTYPEDTFQIFHLATPKDII